MDAMFSLPLRFFPRTKAGTPNATAPAASAVVLRKWRRLGGFFMGINVFGFGGFNGFQPQSI